MGWIRRLAAVLAAQWRFALNGALEAYRGLRSYLFYLRGQIALALLLSAAVYSDQFQEIFRGLASIGLNDSRRLQWSSTLAMLSDHETLFALIAIGLCTASLWYWSRIALSDVADDKRSGPITGAPLMHIVPLIVAAAPPVAVVASLIYAQLPGAIGINVNLAIVAAILILALGLAYEAFRRAEFANAGRTAKPEDAGTSRVGRFVQIATFAGWLIAVAAFALWPEIVGPVLGSAAILFVWGALFAAPVSLLCLYASRLGLPLAGGAIALAVLWAWLDTNDNHEVAWIPGATSSAEMHSVLTDDFKTWMASRPDLDAYRDRPYPVFLIAAEGGGIRAAYFTGMLLSALEDACPQFAEHVYLTTGVSGGSLGVGMFAALLKQHEDLARLPRPLRCTPAEVAAALKDSRSWHVTHMRRILTTDFLSPVIGSLLFDDLLQRLLPAPITAFDRGRAQVAAFDRAWRNEMNSDLTERAVADLKSPRERTVPWTIFSTTRVENGAPVLITAAPLTNLRAAPAPTSSWTYEGPDTLASGISVGWSMSLSARFPWVTPPGMISPEHTGRICVTSSRCRARLVDGGYYENSGTGIVADVAFELATVPVAELAPKGGVKLVILVVANGSATTNADTTASAQLAALGRSETQSFSEVFAPIQTLLNSRSWRSDFSKRHAQDVTATLKVLLNRDRTGLDTMTIQMGAGEVPVPLGWYLADAARNEMERQLVAGNCDDAPDPLHFQFANGCAVEQIFDVINGR